MFNTNCYGNESIPSYSQGVETPWPSHATHSNQNLFHQHGVANNPNAFVSYGLGQVQSKELDLAGVVGMKETSCATSTSSATTNAWHHSHHRMRYSSTAASSRGFLPYQMSSLPHYDTQSVDSSHLTHGTHQFWMTNPNAYSLMQNYNQRDHNTYAERADTSRSTGAIRHNTAMTNRTYAVEDQSRNVNATLQQQPAEVLSQHCQRPSRQPIHQLQQHQQIHHQQEYLRHPITQRERDPCQYTNSSYHQESMRVGVDTTLYHNQHVMPSTQHQHTQYQASEEALRKADSERRAAFTSRQTWPQTWAKAPAYVPFDTSQAFLSNHRSSGSAFQPCNKQTGTDPYSMDSIWTKSAVPTPSNHVPHATNHTIPSTNNHIPLPAQTWIHNTTSHLKSNVYRPPQDVNQVTNVPSNFSTNVLNLDTGQVELSMSVVPPDLSLYSQAVPQTQRHRSTTAHPASMPVQPRHRPLPTPAVPQNYVKPVLKEAAPKPMESSKPTSTARAAGLDVRQFLATWDEDLDVATPRPAIIETDESEPSETAATSLVVLDYQTVPSEEAAGLLQMYPGLQLSGNNPVVLLDDTNTKTNLDFVLSRAVPTTTSSEVVSAPAIDVQVSQSCSAIDVEQSPASGTTPAACTSDPEKLLNSNHLEPSTCNANKNLNIVENQIDLSSQPRSQEALTPLSVSESDSEKQKKTSLRHFRKRKACSAESDASSQCSEHGDEVSAKCMKSDSHLNWFGNDSMDTIDGPIRTPVSVSSAVYDPSSSAAQSPLDSVEEKSAEYPSIPESRAVSVITMNFGAKDQIGRSMPDIFDEVMYEVDQATSKSVETEGRITSNDPGLFDKVEVVSSIVESHCAEERDRESHERPGKHAVDLSGNLCDNTHQEFSDSFKKCSPETQANNLHGEFDSEEIQPASDIYEERQGTNRSQIPNKTDLETIFSDQGFTKNFDQEISEKFELNSGDKIEKSWEKSQYSNNVPSIHLKPSINSDPKPTDTTDREHFNSIDIVVMHSSPVEFENLRPLGSLNRELCDLMNPEQIKTTTAQNSESPSEDVQDIARAEPSHNTVKSDVSVPGKRAKGDSMNAAGDDSENENLLDLSDRDSSDFVNHECVDFARRDSGDFSSPKRSDFISQGPSDFTNTEPIDFTTREPSDYKGRELSDCTSRAPSDITNRESNDSTSREPCDITCQEPSNITSGEFCDITSRKPSDLPSPEPRKITSPGPSECTNRELDNFTSRELGDFTSQEHGDLTCPELRDVTSREPGDLNSREPGDLTSRGPGDLTSREPGDTLSRDSSDFVDWDPIDFSNYAPTDAGNCTPTESRNHVPADSEKHAPADSEKHDPADSEKHDPADSEKHDPADSEKHGPADSEKHGPADSEKHDPADSEKHDPADWGSNDPADSGKHAPADSGKHAPADSENHPPMDSGNNKSSESEYQESIKPESQETRKPDQLELIEPGSVVSQYSLKNWEAIDFDTHEHSDRVNQDSNDSVNLEHADLDNEERSDFGGKMGIDNSVDFSEDISFDPVGEEPSIRCQEGQNFASNANVEPWDKPPPSASSITVSGEQESEDIVSPVCKYALSKLPSGGSQKTTQYLSRIVGSAPGKIPKILLSRLKNVRDKKRRNGVQKLPCIRLTRVQTGTSLSVDEPPEYVCGKGDSQSEDLNSRRSVPDSPKHEFRVVEVEKTDNPVDQCNDFSAKSRWEESRTETNSKSDSPISFEPGEFRATAAQTSEKLPTPERLSPIERFDVNKDVREPLQDDDGFSSGCNPPRNEDLTTAFTNSSELNCVDMRINQTNESSDTDAISRPSTPVSPFEKKMSSGQMLRNKSPDVTDRPNQDILQIRPMRCRYAPKRRLSLPSPTSFEEDATFDSPLQSKSYQTESKHVTTAFKYTLVPVRMRYVSADVVESKFSGMPLETNEDSGRSNEKERSGGQKDREASSWEEDSRDMIVPESCENFLEVRQESEKIDLVYKHNLSPVHSSSDSLKARGFGKDFARQNSDSTSVSSSRRSRKDSPADFDSPWKVNSGELDSSSSDEYDSSDSSETSTCSSKSSRRSSFSESDSSDSDTSSDESSDDEKNMTSTVNKDISSAGKECIEKAVKDDTARAGVDGIGSGVEEDIRSSVEKDIGSAVKEDIGSAVEEDIGSAVDEDITNAGKEDIVSVVEENIASAGNETIASVGEEYIASARKEHIASLVDEDIASARKEHIASIVEEENTSSKKEAMASARKEHIGGLVDEDNASSGKEHMASIEEEEITCSVKEDVASTGKEHSENDKVSNNIVAPAGDELLVAPENEVQGRRLPDSFTEDSEISSCGIQSSGNRDDHRGDFHGEQVLKKPESLLASASLNFPPINPPAIPEDHDKIDIAHSSNGYAVTEDHVSKELLAYENASLVHVTRQEGAIMDHTPREDDLCRALERSVPERPLPISESTEMPCLEKNVGPEDSSDHKIKTDLPKILSHTDEIDDTDVVVDEDTHLVFADDVENVFVEGEDGCVQVEVQDENAEFQVAVQGETDGEYNVPVKVQDENAARVPVEIQEEDALGVQVENAGKVPAEVESDNAAEICVGFQDEDAGESPVEVQDENPRQSPVDVQDENAGEFPEEVQDENAEDFSVEVEEENDGEFPVEVQVENAGEFPGKVHDGNVEAFPVETQDQRAEDFPVRHFHDGKTQEFHIVVDEEQYNGLCNGTMEVFTSDSMKTFTVENIQEELHCDEVVQEAEHPDQGDFYCDELGSAPVEEVVNSETACDIEGEKVNGLWQEESIDIPAPPEYVDNESLVDEGLSEKEETGSSCNEIPLEMKCSLSWDRILNEGQGLVLGPANVEVRVPGQSAKETTHWKVVTRERKRPGTSKTNSCVEENNNVMVDVKSPIVVVKRLVLKRPRTRRSQRKREEDVLGDFWKGAAKILPPLKTKGALKAFQAQTEGTHQRNRNRSWPAASGDTSWKRRSLKRRRSDLSPPARTYSCTSPQRLPKVIIKRTGPKYQSFIYDDDVFMQPFVSIERNAELDHLALTMWSEGSSPTTSIGRSPQHDSSDPTKDMGIDNGIQVHRERRKQPKTGRAGQLMKVVELLQQWRQAEQEAASKVSPDSLQSDCNDGIENNNSLMCIDNNADGDRYLHRYHSSDSSSSSSREGSVTNDISYNGNAETNSRRNLEVEKRQAYAKADNLDVLIDSVGKEDDLVDNTANRNESEDNITHLEDNSRQCDTQEDNKIGSTVQEHDISEEDGVEDNLSVGDRLEENDVEESVLEDNIVEDHALEDNIVDENVLANDVMEECPLEDNVVDVQDDNIVEVDPLEDSVVQDFVQVENTSQQVVQENQMLDVIAQTDDITEDDILNDNIIEEVVEDDCGAHEVLEESTLNENIVKENSSQNGFVEKIVEDIVQEYDNIRKFGIKTLREADSVAQDKTIQKADSAFEAASAQETALQEEVVVREADSVLQEDVYQHDLQRGVEISCTEKDIEGNALSPEQSRRTSIEDELGLPLVCQVCGFTTTRLEEQANHIRTHSYHCQRCQLAFLSQEDFKDHLAAEHPTIDELHHCLLCQRTFPTAERHAQHKKGWHHSQMERSQRHTIHSLYRFFTGNDCPHLPALAPEEVKAFDWLPSDPGVIHFYHDASPLQLAVQFRCRKWRRSWKKSFGWRGFLAIRRSRSTELPPETGVVSLQIRLRLRNVTQIHVQEFVHCQREVEGAGDGSRKIVCTAIEHSPINPV